MLTIDQVNKWTLCARLKTFEGNKAKTAESLGITLKTLYNWLHRWDLDSYIRKPGKQ